LHIFRIN